MLMQRLCLLIALPILGACNALTQRAAVEPYPSSCSSSCFESCPPLAAWEPRADGSGSWDALAELAIEDAALAYPRCDQQRQACVDCLRRLERVGVITIGGQPSPAPERLPDPPVGPASADGRGARVPKIGDRSPE